MKKGALFRFFFAAEARTLLAWSGALAGYNVLNIWLFTVYGTETSIAQVYEKLPRVWKNAFGQYLLSVNSLEGWLATQFFAFLPLLAGAYLAILVSALFVTDEETRAIVCLLTQPVRRRTIWMAKTGVSAACLLVLVVLNIAASLILSAVFVPEAVPVRAVLQSYAMSALFLLFLEALFAAIAVTLPTQKSALAACLGVLVLLFLLNMVLATLEVPLWIRELNPFHYHDASRIVREHTLPARGMAYWAVGVTLFGAAGLLRFTLKERG